MSKDPIIQDLGVALARVLATHFETLAKYARGDAPSVLRLDVEMQRTMGRKPYEFTFRVRPVVIPPESTGVELPAKVREDVLVLHVEEEG